MKAVFSFEQKVARFDALDRDLSVLAQAATAATVGCSWCLDFGYYLAHSEGMDLQKIREVMRWRESDVFSPVEREVLGYAEAMSTTPLTVTDEMVASLLGHLGEEAVVELTMMIAIENERARFNSARPAGTGVLGRLRDPPAGSLLPARRTVDVVSAGTDAFVKHRNLLFTVAYEMLGSAADAEDVLQETWLRWAAWTTTRCATSARTWCGSPHDWRSTTCAPSPVSGRPTSVLGCPSRC